MLRRLTWLWPRRPYAPQAMLAETALREAALLGLAGLGGLAAFGRAAAAGRLDEATAALAVILPRAIGYVLLQADLTAVAPGPLTADLARELSLAADVESTGGATVYRFSAGSVRRALDAGRTGDALLALLRERSRTPVPQPLRYLIEDVARGHGRIRVGTASAYVRCDDPAVAAEIAADRRAAELRLRPLAPTVLVSRPGAARCWRCCGGSGTHRRPSRRMAPWRSRARPPGARRTARAGTVRRQHPVRYRLARHGRPRSGLSPPSACYGPATREPGHRC